MRNRMVADRGSFKQWILVMVVELMEGCILRTKLATARSKIGKVSERSLLQLGLCEWIVSWNLAMLRPLTGVTT